MPLVNSLSISIPLLNIIIISTSCSSSASAFIFMHEQSHQSSLTYIVVHYGSNSLSYETLLQR